MAAIGSSRVAGLGGWQWALVVGLLVSVSGPSSSASAQTPDDARAPGTARDSTLIAVDPVDRGGADGYRDRPLPGEQPVPIVIDGRPPANFRMPAIELPRSDVRSVVVLPDVPAFDWCFGCSATSAAMLAGYFDRTSSPNMYAGTANGGVCPLHNDGNPIGGPGHCALSATENGLDGRVIRGHVNDYWIAYGNSGPDPFIVNGWPEHTHSDCTADFMGTNQSEFGNVDGGTTFWLYTSGAALHNYDAGPNGRDGCFGLRLFVESRGYVVNDNFTQLIRGQGSDPNLGFTFNDFMAEVNAGRPVLIQVQGHTMLGFGYESGTQTVYIHDTWDFADHQMTWGASYAGMAQWGVSVMQVQGGGPAVQVGDINCDGTYGYGSFGDINPFVLYLSNLSAWQAAYPGCDPRNGDINGDGTYPSFGDINPFVALLSGR